MGMAAEPQFHVLAVDDSLIDRKLIERLLKTSSYQVTTVDSGNKALEFLGFQEDQHPSVFPNNHQEIEVNLIITDYCMPGMTGYDLLKKVKESSSLRNIPVVIMSSENVPSRINRCLEEGAEEFFLKPVRLSDVNRLKPHMLRAKYGPQQEQNMIEECQKPEQRSKQQQQQPQTPLSPHQQQPEHRLISEQQKQQQTILLPHQRQSEHQRISEQKQLQPLQQPHTTLLLYQQQSEQELISEQQKQPQTPLSPHRRQSEHQLISEQQKQPQPLQRLSDLGQQPDQQLQQQHHQQQQQQQGITKRKSIEEGLSPDRTRPRYNGLTTVV